MLARLLARARCRAAAPPPPWRLARSAAARASSSCVCGLDPCLTPHCAAMDWTHGTFAPDARSLAPYQGTPESVAAAMLTLAALAPGERFVDLGAGDGRVLLHAVQHFDAGSAVGYELDPAVHALALAHVAARLGDSALAARVSVVCGDARDADVAGAHVVALYLLPEGHAAMAPLLAARLPRGCGTRVVAHGWPLPDWAAAEERVTTMGTRLYLYRR
jgi:SAM-dependent methyltransferase